MLSHREVAERRRTGHLSTGGGACAFREPRPRAIVFFHDKETRVCSGVNVAGGKMKHSVVGVETDATVDERPLRRTIIKIETNTVKLGIEFA